MKARKIKRRLMQSANSFPVRVERSYRQLGEKLQEPRVLAAWRKALTGKRRHSRLTQLLNQMGRLHPQ